MGSAEIRPQGTVTELAHRIFDALLHKRCESRVRRNNGAPGDYEALTGVSAPTAVVELWSVLGGRDILGMNLEGARSAGRFCAARASEAESGGAGSPYEALDGSADGAVRMVWWDRGWCPLTATADSAIAVDTHPGVTGRVGQVIYCDFDVYSDREAVWDCVADFLGDLLVVVSSESLAVEDGFARIPNPEGWDMSVMVAVLEVGRARRDGRPVPLLSTA
ncbi:hypothetical protein ACWEVD_24190 [Nocardia thailandica]